MSKYQFREIGEWDWYSPFRGFGRGRGQLHLIVSADWGQSEHDWFVEQGTTACGRTTGASIAGMFSRMGATRCPKCCTAVGYPRGVGSPKNDEAVRPLTEQRLAYLHFDESVW